MATLPAVHFAQCELHLDIAHILWWRWMKLYMTGKAWWIATLVSFSKG
jgi:hypothetical protein